MKLRNIIIVLGLASLLFISCHSLPKGESWKTEETELDQYLEIVFMPGEDGRAVHIGSSFLEGAYFTGTAYLQDDGSYLLYIDYLNWFNNWSDGWTRATFSMWGTLRMTMDKGQARITVEEQPQLETVKSGRLRFRNNTIYEDQARDQIQRRWDRMETLGLFLHERLEGRSFDQRETVRKKYLGTYEGFEDTVRPLLFPEVYGYPAGYVPGESFAVSREEGISWNTDYTAETFPEELHAIRNSGTMFRDFEESPTMLYLAYIWPDLWETTLTTAVFLPEE